MDFEGDVLGFVGFVFDGGFFGVYLDVVDDGTQFLRFILSVGDLGAILLVKFIGERTWLYGVLIQVEIGLGEGIG